MESPNKSYAFEGRGKVFLTPVIGGVEGAPFWVGVADAVNISHSTDGSESLIERHSGKDQEWDTTDGTTTTELSINLQERRIDALTAALQATVTTVAAASVTAEPHHNADKVGSLILLKHPKVSDVVITDSTSASPQPLAIDVDYTLDAEYGRIELKNDGFVMPLNVDYSYGEVTEVKPLTSDVDYYAVRIENMNKVGQKDKQLVQVYKFKPTPTSALDVINEGYASSTLEGKCLYDDSADRKGAYKLTKL